MAKYHPATQTTKEQRPEPVKQPPIRQLRGARDSRQPRNAPLANVLCYYLALLLVAVVPALVVVLAAALHSFGAVLAISPLSCRQRAEVRPHALHPAYFSSLRLCAHLRTSYRGHKAPSYEGSAANRVPAALPRKPITLTQECHEPHVKVHQQVLDAPAAVTSHRTTV